MRSRKLRVHFNRVNMQRGKPGVWTIHRSDVCIAARKVRSYVELETVFKPDGPQPRAYLAGEGVVIDCGDQDYVITTVQQAAALISMAKADGKIVRIV